jgi:predicted nucleic acid-binding protein
MSDFPFPRECIILDIRCIINLYASKNMKNILEALPEQVMVASYVRDLVDAKSIYNVPLEGLKRGTEVINLQPFIDDKLLQVVSLENDAEENMVVNFSSVGLGNGEAITAAIALLRQWSLGIDDQMAISFFMRKIPQLHLTSTLDTIKHWVEITDPDLTVISHMLKNIQNRASYKPHDSHHLYRWWKQHNST